MRSHVNVEGKDIPIEMLTPLKERQINLKKHRGFQRIKSTIETVGLIEPLCVYKEANGYVILDGYLRFKALQELDITTVPCWIHKDKEAYTYNRMVNRLSTVQQSRMLHQSLDTLDRKTIEQVFGLKTIGYRLATNILSQLHASIIKAVDKGAISRRCATQLTHVKKERQEHILKEMKRTSDYSISFARALIIKTTPEMRSQKGQANKPWAGNNEKKKQLVEKLEEVQNRYDFYSNLYRQYSTDLLRLCVYARKLISNETIARHLEDSFPEILDRLQSIVFDTQGHQAIAG